MALSTALSVAGLVLLGVLLWLVWRLVRSPLPLEMQEALERKEESKLQALREEWAKRLGEEFDRVWRQLHGQVQATEQSVSQKLQQANSTYAQLSHDLGRLQEATRRVEEVGRSVATLEDLLRAPKLQGGLGEFLLADLLAQVFPQGSGIYALEHGFSDGERVDAVIRLQERLVPIDSKFPLESFRRMSRAATDEEKASLRRQLLREVRGHIDSIAEKYIRPSEGTFDFALMYIPAENVYYEAVLRDEPAEEQGIFQHATLRRVIPVSPNSFYAYLQVILLGLRGLAVERRAQEILEGLIKLQKEFAGVQEDFDVAGKQIRHALTNFERADRRLGRFEDKLQAIESAPEETPGRLARPDAISIKEE